MISLNRFFAAMFTVERQCSLLLICRFFPFVNNLKNPVTATPLDHSVTPVSGVKRYDDYCKWILGRPLRAAIIRRLMYAPVMTECALSCCLWGKIAWNNLLSFLVVDFVVLLTRCPSLFSPNPCPVPAILRRSFCIVWYYARLTFVQIPRSALCVFFLKVKVSIRRYWAWHRTPARVSNHWWTQII